MCVLLSATAFGADAASPIASAAMPPSSASSTAPSSAFVAAAQTKLPEAPSHRFFDRTNVTLHAANFAMITGDMISTRLILDGGGREQNPLARPFVTHGLAGQVAASYAIGAGGTLLGSYWLHRTGHHRLERWTPICVMAVEGFATAANAHLLATGPLVKYRPAR
jgi:hypothetical protein